MSAPEPRLDPSDLAAARCVPADASTQSVDASEAARLAAGLDASWRIDGQRLVREFRFASFGAAFGLATRIALLAEGHGHHPELTIVWGLLTVTWRTDAIGALSANDFVMAAKVDRLVGRGLAIRGG